jgi:hypothetical protein
VKQSTEEARAKGEKFSKLVKRNELPHHLGMIGYMLRWKSGYRKKGKQLRPGSRIH